MPSFGPAAQNQPALYRARFKRWGVGSAKLAVFAADSRPSAFNSLRGFIAGRYRYLAAYRLGWRQFISFKIRFDLYENRPNSRRGPNRGKDRNG